MIRIAIVDDEPFFVDELSGFINDYQKEKGLNIELTIYRDGDEILQKFRSQFDIILMDIQMKFVDGMTAAEEIRRKDSQVVILFITNLTQYAIRGYEVRAFDYVVKPVSYFAFSQKLAMAIAQVHKQKSCYVTLTTKDGVARVETSDIYYIESIGHNLIYHTHKGDLMGSGTIKATEEMFSDLHFSRINKGNLVNLEKVEGIKDKCAIVNGQTLAIARPRYESFMKDMTNYWSEVE